VFYGCLVVSLPIGLILMITITDHPATLDCNYSTFVKYVLSILSIHGPIDYWILQLSILGASVILAFAATNGIFSGFLFLVPVMIYVNSVPFWMKALS
jgi:hypothetical protein